MAQRRYGPVGGAGVVIIEEDADKPIELAALGVTGYAGILQKGRIGELIRASTATAARNKVGSYISESLVPDAIFDFFEHGANAGELYLVRVTDGNELTASLDSKNRVSPLRTSVLTCDADNAGRWAGKKQTVVGQYTSVTNTTLSTGKTPKTDEWVGGTLVLAELPGRSFKIEGNDDAGIISLAPDVTLADDLTASGGGDLTYAVSLVNEGKAVSVLYRDGLENPTTEWGLDIYEDDVLVKSYDNLSSDPDSGRYFESIVNDDDSNYWVKLTDTYTGTLSADTRPANYAGVSTSLTATVLTREATEIQVSAVNNASASFSEALGSAIMKDTVTLACTAAGTRPVGTIQVILNPSDTDTLTVDFSAMDGVAGTKVITWKTVVADPTAEVLIGGDANASAANLQAFLDGMDYADGYFKYEVATDTVTVTALDANDVHNAGTEFTGTGSAWHTLVQVGTGTPGVDQTWDYTSAAQTDLPATVVTTGKTFAAPNAWLVGGILHSTHATDDFAIADTITLVLDPFPVNELVGGFLIPDKVDRRIKFQIIANTATTITVKTGSDMTADAALGDTYIVQAPQELSGGYDGIAEISDQDYIDVWSVSDGLFNQLFGKNKGLVKLGNPGVTATAVLSAGAAYAEAKNYQFRYEVPANVTQDESVEALINDTIGRNDFAVVSFPSFGYVVDPLGDGGLKLISLMGAIHGREARTANDFQGYHKAAAGTDITLPRVVKLPTGERVLDEELLNPEGINVIKKKEGNFIIWGDRTVGIDPAFKFKHQREYLSHIEHILQENFDWIIFSINNTSTRESAATSLYILFSGQYDIGAFEGDTFEEAVLIKIDDEINTPAVAAAGDLVAQIRVKIVNTVERFNISIGKAGIFEELA
jgi:hypothetical protein